MKEGQILTLDAVKNGREMDHKELLSYFNQHGPLFWSWGASGFTKVSDSCLSFKVNGHHHKGMVYIYLNGGDTFDIYLTDNKKMIVKVFNDIYIMELFETIDEAVEKINAYKN